MEKSPVIFKARALGLARALKLITRAFLGFADPIDFINVTDLMSLYTVQYTIVKWFFYYRQLFIIQCYHFKSLFLK